MQKNSSPTLYFLGKHDWQTQDLLLEALHLYHILFWVGNASSQSLRHFLHLLMSSCIWLLHLLSFIWSFTAVNQRFFIALAFWLYRLVLVSRTPQMYLDTGLQLSECWLLISFWCQQSGAVKHFPNCFRVSEVLQHLIHLSRSHWCCC